MQDVGETREDPVLECEKILDGLDAPPADVAPDLPGAFSSGPTAPASSSSDGNLVRGAREHVGFRLPGYFPAEVAVAIEAPPPPPNEEPMPKPMPLMPSPPPAEAPAPEAEGQSALARIGSNALANLPKMPSAQMPARLQRATAVSPSAALLSMLRSAPGVYCKLMARCPGAFFLLYLIIIVTTIIIGWSARKLEINTDLEQFRQIDGPAANTQAMYNEALKSQRATRNQTDLHDRKAFEVHIFYQAKSGSVFSEASLRDIRSLEHQLRNLPGWISMCAKADPRARFRCEPGESLENYAWPQREELLSDAHTPFTYDFDGKGPERMPVHAFLTYLKEGTAAPHELRKFLPHSFGGLGQDSNLLRSVFAFTEPTLGDAGYEKSYKEFVSSELYPALKNATVVAEEEPDDPWAEPWNVSIFFRGDIIDAHEVRLTWEQDMKWSLGAWVLLFFIMWLQLRSLFLAFGGLIIISSGPLLAYVFVPIKALNLASFLCVFLIIGSGSNHLLASCEYWKHVGRELKWAEPRDGPFVPEKSAVNAYHKLRLAQLFPRMAMRFVPEFFSMCSYLVLLASLLRPVREFGMYMFACMATTAVLCFTLLVPLLVIHDKWILPLAKKLPEKLGMVLEPKNLRFPWRPATSLFAKAARKAGGKILIGTALVSIIIFIIMIVVSLNSDNPGLPELYSPSHHRYASRPLIEAFVPCRSADEPPPSRAFICQPDKTTTVVVGNTSHNCGLYWCEAPLANTTSTASSSSEGITVAAECSCNSPANALSPDCEQIAWDTEMVGQAFVSLSSTIQLDTWKTYLKGLFQNGEVTESGTTISRLPSLVLEHWKSGKTDVEPQVQMPTVNIRTTKTTGQSCTYHTTCFCGSRKCAPRSDRRQGINTFTLQTSRRLSSKPAPSAPLPVYHRRLSDKPSIPAPSAKEVFIVFGILPTSSEPFFAGDAPWTYDEDFNAPSPWAQRAMLSMCSDLPANLNVLEKQCWIIQFRQFMVSQSRKFPVERFGDFQGELRQFRAAYPNTITAMWLNQQDEMRATAFGFKIPPRSDAWASEIMEDRDKWNSYVASQNERAQTPACNAFATAQVWVDAEAQDAIMRNAWHVLVLAIGVSILAGLIYTWDLVFMLLTIIISLLACIWMAFFMFCLFGWAAGPWELILLIKIPGMYLEPVFRIGRGAVWSDYQVQEKVMNQLSPRSQAAKKAAQPGAPLAIQDAEAPSGSADDAPQRTKTGAEADLISTESSTEARTLSDAQRRFQARLLKYLLSVANSVFGNALKMILCGIMMLPCEFRLFTRMGAIAIVAPLVILPCIFILLPAALFLYPTPDVPDAIRCGNCVYSKVQGERI
mmetsp:Transcript_55098/g.100973  ORF Transcript_55098/g.100973 Transcript_55098/m.100973 type:complete len:1339 (-) Transcript_55098:87-4103(-)